MRLRVVGLAEHMTAAGLVRPVFPGPPGFRRIGAIAAVAGIDLSLPQIFDLTSQLRNAQERARVARQIDRHPHYLDERAPRRSKAVTAHQCDIVVHDAFRPNSVLLLVCYDRVDVTDPFGYT